ncbi:MAG: EAL domain-containing protein, partial [Oscillospiraceae bacterium]|nr:EAL domain-containing protein [Oscillospiraceae bacterium]
LVEFELTENIYMKNFSKADEFIKDCRNRGIQVSMDDFGSGYSSLNVISTLSIDTLKIDKIFLKNDNLNDNDKIVIESMIAMAKRLGMKVICEGVETESQTIFLKNAQCDQIQGYYYGKPMDEETFNQFIEKLLP